MPLPSGGALLLLGRGRETAELGEALGLAAEGTPQVVLVGGDAGLGKTTLVADLERRATELGFTVATGHCLDLEAGISFAPVVEAVRALLAGLDDLHARPSARRMLSLLDPSAPRSRASLRVLDDLTTAVLEAASVGPVLMVLEDMHWADTLDPGLRGRVGRDRPRGPAAGAHLPQRRAASSASVPHDVGRDHPDPGVPSSRPRRVGSRRHRGPGRGPHRRATGPGAGGFGAGAVCGQPAVRRGAAGRGPGRGPGSSVRSAAGPHRRPRAGSAGAAAGRLGQRDPARHRDPGGAGGTRPARDGRLSAGGAGRQRAASGGRVLWSSGTRCCARRPTTT